MNANTTGNTVPNSEAAVQTAARDLRSAVTAAVRAKYPNGTARPGVSDEHVEQMAFSRWDFRTRTLTKVTATLYKGMLPEHPDELVGNVAVEVTEQDAHDETHVTTYSATVTPSAENPEELKPEVHGIFPGGRLLSTTPDGMQQALNWFTGELTQAALAAAQSGTTQTM